MIRASYFDPANDKAVEIERCSAADVPGTLSLSTDGELAYLIWTGLLGDSLHSVGSDQNRSEPLVFDYFGS